ncbi:MAG TPA: rRNA maturation RNase YbeY [Thermodesulfovibrionales bacterium]|nr:rRNA maturation RNase YbeY [Thermodesulfovibrionales bacterium]
MKVLIENRQKLVRIHHRKIEKDSLILLKSFGLERAELGVLLVSDGRMKKLNHRYRGIAKATDVLSFPLYASVGEMPGDREFLLGDIVINLPAAKRQAAEYGLTFGKEVRRLLIHGFLHLLGYDHEKNSYQKKKMKMSETELRNTLEAVD